MAKQNKLTDKQRKFIDEYLIDLNATQAAIRAGYSTKTARMMGTENLAKPYISSEIHKRQKAHADKLAVTCDRVLNELASIGFATTSDFVRVANNRVYLVDTDMLSREVQPALAGVKENKFGVEIKLHDKVRALEMLGKHLGLFERDKHASKAHTDIEDITTLAELINYDDTDTDD